MAVRGKRATTGRRSPRQEAEEEEDRRSTGDGDDSGGDRFGRGGIPQIEADTVEKPIGVPQGYTASSTYYDPREQDSRFTRNNPQAIQREIAPQYFEGDQYAPRNNGPERIRHYQQLLGEMGLLRGPFTPRVWDENTAEAWKSVLAYANQHGLTDQQALMELGSGARDGRFEFDEAGNLIPVGAGSAPPPLVTRTTDPAILKDIFRRAWIDIGGIGASGQEVATAAAAYNAMERQRQQAAYDAQTVGGEIVDIPDPMSFIETYVRDIDPAAVEENEALGFAGEAMSLLSSPAWGVG